MAEMRNIQTVQIFQALKNAPFPVKKQLWTLRQDVAKFLQEYQPVVAKNNEPDLKNSSPDSPTRAVYEQMSKSVRTLQEEIGDSPNLIRTLVDELIDEVDQLKSPRVILQKIRVILELHIGILMGLYGGVFNAALCTCKPGSGNKQCEPCGHQVAKICGVCEKELDKKSWSYTKKLNVLKNRCNDREKENVYKKIIDLLHIVDKACHYGEPLRHGVPNRKEGKQWNWVDDAARALSLLTKVELRSGETDKSLVLSSSDDFTLDSLTNINLELKRLEAREAKLTQEGSECSVVNHLKRFSKILNSVLYLTEN
jgi:hypothetical protein